MLNPCRDTVPDAVGGIAVLCLVRAMTATCIRKRTDARLAGVHGSAVSAYLRILSYHNLLLVLDLPGTLSASRARNHVMGIGNNALIPANLTTWETLLQSPRPQSLLEALTPSLSIISEPGMRHRYQLQ